MKKEYRVIIKLPEKNGAAPDEQTLITEPVYIPDSTMDDIVRGRKLSFLSFVAIDTGEPIFINPESIVYIVPYEEDEQDGKQDS